MMKVENLEMGSHISVLELKICLFHFGYNQSHKLYRMELNSWDIVIVEVFVVFLMLFIFHYILEHLTLISWAIFPVNAIVMGIKMGFCGYFEVVRRNICIKLS